MGFSWVSSWVSDGGESPVRMAHPDCPARIPLRPPIGFLVATRPLAPHPFLRISEHLDGISSIPIALSFGLAVSHPVYPTRLVSLLLLLLAFSTGLLALLQESLPLPLSPLLYFLL